MLANLTARRLRRTRKRRAPRCSTTQRCSGVLYRCSIHKDRQRSRRTAAVKSEAASCPTTVCTSERSDFTARDIHGSPSFVAIKLAAHRQSSLRPGTTSPIAMPLVLMSYHICKALDDGPLQWRSRVQLYILSRFIRE